MLEMCSFRKILIKDTGICSFRFCIYSQSKVEGRSVFWYKQFVDVNTEMQVYGALLVKVGLLKHVIPLAVLKPKSIRLYFLMWVFILNQTYKGNCSTLRLVIGIPPLLNVKFQKNIHNTILYKIY